MPGPLGLSGKAYEDHVKELARLRKQRQRARSRDGHGTAGAQKEARHVTPPDPPTGVQSIKSLPPLVSRLAERLAGFGRGYQDNARSRGRLTKLVGDFPHLDAEEQVEDALDWLERPENAKRYCNVGFLRNWMAIEEAKREARVRAAAQSVVPSPAFGTNLPGTQARVPAPALNGHYQQPQTLQKNPNPEADLPRWDDETARRSDAGREKVRELMPWRRRTR